MTENLGRRNSSCLVSFSKCWNHNFEFYVFATLYYATFLCVSSLNFLFFEYTYMSEFLSLTLMQGCTIHDGL